MDNSLMGREAEDRITGFKGFITGIASYITGCDQCLLQPKTKKKEYVEGRWFDANRIIIDIDSSERISIASLEAPIELGDKDSGPGGPQSNTAPTK